MRPALAALLVAAPLAAQEAVAPDEFRAFAEGWTLHFELDGAPFGAETYHPGGGVLWRPEGGQCQAGLWTADGGEVCFHYDAGGACWRMFRDRRGLFAIPSDAKAPLLRVKRRDRARLACGEVPVG